MHLIVMNRELVISGRFPKVIKLAGEYFEWIEDPQAISAELKALGTGADIFTFLQRLPEKTAKYNFHVEAESVALLPLSTYEEWWKKQINDKTRNMIRRAQKSNVTVRVIPFDDDLVRAIKRVYDETPVRQGKPFRHYQKSLEQLKAEHITFLDRSDFIGAFLDDEMIGFVKLVYDEGVGHLMQIIAMVAHRDKAPTNALLAKAVELCADHGIHYLHYSTWSKRGLGDFKKHHAFQRHDALRYYVPLNVAGEVALRLGLHRELADLLPEKVVDFAISLRNKWNSRKLAPAR